MGLVATVILGVLMTVVTIALGVAVFDRAPGDDDRKPVIITCSIVIAVLTLSVVAIWV